MELGNKGDFTNVDAQATIHIVTEDSDVYYISVDNSDVKGFVKKDYFEKRTTEQ